MRGAATDVAAASERAKIGTAGAARGDQIARAPKEGGYGEEEVTGAVDRCPQAYI
jgi:hypothetical protein